MNRSFVLTSALALAIGLVARTPTHGDEPPSGVDYSQEAREKAEPVLVSDGAPWRQPIALVLAPDGQALYVLTRRSPSLTVIDLSQDRPDIEVHPLDGEPAGMARTADGRLTIIDSAKNRLIIMNIREHDVHHVSHPIGDEPRAVVASRTYPLAWVSLRRDRAVACIDVDSGRLKFVASLDFAPHCLALDSAEKRLYVADAFRGNVAAIDAQNGELLARHLFPGTNIRGLALNDAETELYFAHQIISEKSIIERELVRWGAFITNNIRRVPLDVLLDADADAVAKSQLAFVGDFAKGAGDPGELVLSGDSAAVLCLSGVNEVGVDSKWPFQFMRLAVGRRPVSAAIDAPSRRAYVANMFDDSISVIDLDAPRVEKTLSLGPLPAFTAAMRGEVLFHDATLSLDNWYSCQSCHTDGGTNGSNSDTRSDGGFGAPKNTPSLLGVGQTGPWSWVGGFNTLDGQVESTLENTMLSRRSAGETTADLAAYLKSLHVRDQTPSEAGRSAFVRLGCAECHAGDAFTSDGTHDVQLDDGPGGHKKFNAPSLRLVSHTAPYFHDGRARSLEEVLVEHRHQVPENASNEDIKSVLEYLRGL